MSTDRLMAETFRNLTFWKMTGSGNDFVFFDGRQIDASEIGRASCRERVCLAV